jgi:hypothetical protein
VVSFPGDDPARIQPTKNATLYWPLSDNFPVVDAVLTAAQSNSRAKVAATLIQVTVAKEHKPKKGATQRLYETLQRAKCKVTAFVWVVDGASALQHRQSLESGNYQPYDDTPQYVCRVGHPMCWVRKNKAGDNTAVAFPVPAAANKDDIMEMVKAWVDPAATKIINYKNAIGTSKHPVIFE